MKMKRNSILFLLCLGVLSVAGYLYAEEAAHVPFTLDAATTEEKVMIGDTIHYTVRITTKDPIEFDIPPMDQTLQTFAVRDFGKKEKKLFKKRTIILWYELDTYITGKQTIPSLTIQYRFPGETEWKQASTKEVSVEVISLLTSDKNAQDIRDIKEPLSAGSSLVLLLALCGLGIIAGGSYGGYVWLRNHRKSVQERKRPAHEIAFEALEALRKSDLISANDIKGYYFELSLIVRTYVENRFHIKAPDMTTEEFLARVRDESVLAHEHKSLLREFLVQSDMVKFAKYGPTDEEIRRSFDAARHFIEQTQEKTDTNTREEDL